PRSSSSSRGPRRRPPCFFYIRRRPPRPPLFPYTTLFRSPSGEVCVAREANNYCAPVDDPDVAEAVESLRARGLRCPKTALQDVLPEAVVVQHRDSRHVEDVSIDETLRLAEAGAVRIQRACH